MQPVSQAPGQQHHDGGARGQRAQRDGQAAGLRTHDIELARHIRQELIQRRAREPVHRDHDRRPQPVDHLDHRGMCAWYSRHPPAPSPHRAGRSPHIAPASGSGADGPDGRCTAPPPRRRRSNSRSARTLSRRSGHRSSRCAPASRPDRGVIGRPPLRPSPAAHGECADRGARSSGCHGHCSSSPHRAPHHGGQDSRYNRSRRSARPASRSSKARMVEIASAAPSARRAGPRMPHGQHLDARRGVGKAMQWLGHASCAVASHRQRSDGGQAKAQHCDSASSGTSVDPEGLGALRATSRCAGRSRPPWISPTSVRPRRSPRRLA